MSLYLSKNNNGARGVIALAQGLKNSNAGLCNLRFSCNNIGDDGAKALADVAIRDDSTALETLRLGYCGPTKKHHPYGKLDNVGGAGSALIVMAFF